MLLSVGKPRILVVEDEPIVARDIQQQLKQLGYTPVGHATRGEQAIALARELQPDLVMMDIQLAGAMDGVAAAQAIREQFAIPVVFLTAYSNNETLSRAKLTEPFGYILKPFSERELHTVIEMALYKHKAEASLRASEERFRNLTMELQVGVLIQSPSTEIVFSNPMASTLLGLNDEQIVGKTSLDPEWDVIHEDGTPFPSSDRPTLRAVATRQPVRNVVMGYFRRISQERVWLLVNSNPQLNPDGSVRQVISSFTDITERRRAEEMARVSDTALKAVSQGVIITDHEQRILSVNDAFVSITGYAKSEVTGLNCSLLQGTDTDQSTVEAIRQALKKGIVFNGEILNYRKDYSVFWNELTISPVRNKQGVLTHFIGVTRDITERKRSEQALRDSEARFRQLAENIDQVFWIKDPAKAQLDYVSPAYEKIWGRSCASLYASPLSWLEAIHADDREQVRTAVLTYLEHGDYSATYRVVRPDGSMRWVRDCAFPIRNDKGEIFRVVGTASDITENRNLEEQVRQSQKMEAFGLLAGGVAHDFNNLMSVVIGYSDICLMKRPAVDSIQRPLNAIKAAGVRAADLTKQLLAFSRKSILAPKVLDLNAIVRDLEEILMPLVGEDIRIVSIHDPSISKVKVDPGQIGQLMINLAANARDAMPRGGELKIQTGMAEFDDAYVRSHPGTQPGRQVVLSVSDTGCGMKPEVKARIFEPFFTTKGVGKGSGLGLAVVHGIVAQSGGTIQVESQIGRGTTFKFFFPEAARIAPTERRPDEISQHAGSETILVVEDEDCLRELVEETLRSFGYTVFSAHSGAEALKLAENNATKLDLMLTDVVMPGMNGRELADLLKPKLPKLKTMFMSGYTEDAIMRKGIDQQRVAFIQKPFAPYDLLKRIRGELDKG